MPLTANCTVAPEMTSEMQSLKTRLRDTSVHGNCDHFSGSWSRAPLNSWTG